MTENDVIGILEQRYPAPAWAFFPFFRNQTGYQYRLRTADAIAMSLYPSRGLDVYGFEVKVSRGDWLRELRSPEKAEGTFKGVDFVIIVAPPDVVQKGEVPAKWGHAVVNGSKLRHVKAGERLIPESSDFSRAFVASILRRSNETVQASPLSKELRDKFDAGAKAGRAAGEENSKVALEHLQDEIRRYQSRIKEFEEKSGIQINGWEAGKIGDAVNALLRADIDFCEMSRDIGRMKDLADTVKIDVDNMITLYTELENLKKKQAARVQ
jgi:hypothetical protein